MSSIKQNTSKQLTITLTREQVAIVQANHGPKRLQWSVIAKRFGISQAKLDNNLKIIKRPLRSIAPMNSTDKRRKGKQADAPGSFSWSKFVQSDFILKPDRLYPTD